MAASSVSIVIPSYNGRDLLGKHLPSVVKALEQFTLQSPLHGGEIVVVDDGSSDGTGAFLREEFPHVVPVSLPLNRGYAPAVNAGVQRATGEVIACLNSDLTVDPFFLSPLLAPFDDPEVFAVGAKVLVPVQGGYQNESIHRIVFKAGRLHQERFSSHLPEGMEEPTLIPYATGAAVAYRRSLFLDLGGLDELFSPFYWEDLDLCYRAWKRGWKVLYQPKSVVYHVRNVTINRSFSTPEINRIFWRNLLILNWKNLTDPSLFLQHLITIPFELLFALPGRRRFFLSAFWDAFKLLPSIREKRRKEKELARSSDRALLQRFRELPVFQGK